MLGAQSSRGVLVNVVYSRLIGRVTGVTWQQRRRDRHDRTEQCGDCGGMWGRGSWPHAIGVTLAASCLRNIFYIVTESIPGLPIAGTRVPGMECAYYKEDAGKLLRVAVRTKG